MTELKGVATGEPAFLPAVNDHDTTVLTVEEEEEEDDEDLYKIGDFIVCSILSSVLCFPPLGVGALIYSVMARSWRDRGQMVAARGALRLAFLLNTWAVVVGSLLYLVGLLLIVLSLHGITCFSELSHFCDHPAE